MRTTRARLASVVVAAVLVSACGSEESASSPSTDVITGEPSTGDDLPTTAPSCPSDEFPTFGALDLERGGVVWSLCSPVEAYRTVIGANDDVVLVSEATRAGPQTVMALAAADGSERWRISNVGIGASDGPFDGAGTVVLFTDGAGERSPIGVDVLTGKQTWRVDSPGNVLGLTDRFVVVGDALINPSSGPPKLHGLDRATGERLWETQGVLSHSSDGAAAVDDDVIVVPNMTGGLSGIAVSSGETVWTGSQPLNSPEAVDGMIIGEEDTRGAGPQSVVAIDADSGDHLWTAPGHASYGGAIALGDGVAVILALDSVVAYELDSGAERWRVPRTRGPSPEPQLIDGTSVVMLWEGDLSVLSTADGSTVWSTREPFQSPLMNDVATNGTTIFVAINSLPWTD